jgi:hypothetical protein
MGKGFSLEAANLEEQLARKWACLRQKQALIEENH